MTDQPCSAAVDRFVARAHDLHNAFTSGLDVGSGAAA